MATTRRSASRRRSNLYTRPRAKRSSAPKVTKPKMSAAELRQKLGNNFLMQIKVNLTRSEMTGTIQEITERLTRKAEQADIVGAWEIKDGSTGDSWSRTNVFQLIGSRPYTDAELEKAGPRLIVQKERREKALAAKKAKDLETLRALAKRHGLPDPTAGSTYTSGAETATNGRKTTLRELKQLAKKQGIKGSDRMTREQLENMLTSK